MKTLFLTIIVLLIASCHSKKEYNSPSEDMSAAYSQAERAVEDRSIPAQNAVDKIEKKIIRTAETRFKVKNVKSATREVEQITATYDGFVQSSEMNSEVQRTEYTKVSKDSLMEVQEVRVTNYITIRVPIENFDTVLARLEKLHVFLDYKKINDDDVSLTYYSNKLRIKNKTETSKRIKDAISNGGKINDIVNAEQTAAAMEEQNISNKINNLSIDAQARFSTINIFIYQPGFIFKNMVPDNNVESYSPSFWNKLGKAFLFGWDAFLQLILLIAHIWFVFLIGALALLAIRVVHVYNKKKKGNS